MQLLTSSENQGAAMKNSKEQKKKKIQEIVPEREEKFVGKKLSFISPKIVNKKSFTISHTIIQ